MRGIFRAIAWSTIILTTVWAFAVVLNGKVLADRVFMASIDDIYILMALECATVVAMLVLLVTRKQPDTGDRVHPYRWVEIDESSPVPPEAYRSEQS